MYQFLRDNTLLRNILSFRKHDLIGTIFYFCELIVSIINFK